MIARWCKLVATICLFLMVACAPDDEQDLVGVYLNEGLIYTQRLKLNSDATYEHIVFQTTGNSLSTNVNTWAFDNNSETKNVVLRHFNPVVTHKDFAEHRMGFAKVSHRELSLDRGFLGIVILTIPNELPIEFVRID